MLCSVKEWVKMERIIFIDVETSGLSALRGGRVIEIGAVVVEGCHVVDEYAALIDSGVSISYGAFQVHGMGVPIRNNINLKPGAASSAPT